MKRTATIVTIPASEKTVVSYTTTDGQTFNDKRHAVWHQRLHDSTKVRDTLPEHNGWFRVTSQTELTALWECASNGRWWDSGKEHYVSFPAWVRVSAYQDGDRYWHTEILSLTDRDLEHMVKEGGTSE